MRTTWTYEYDLAGSQDSFYYIEVFYNRKRLHSTLGSMSPVAYTLQHCQAHMA